MGRCVGGGVRCVGGGGVVLVSTCFTFEEGEWLQPSS